MTINNTSAAFAAHHLSCIARRLAIAILCWAVLHFASVAQAGVLEIQISGLHLQYDGTSIFDAGVHNTVGNGNPADATPLTSMEFYLDNTLIGTLNSDIYADIYIADVLNIPVGGGLVNSVGNGDAFGVDLLTSNQLPGWGLALNIDTMQFLYTGSQIAITLAGVASTLFAQDLPFDLEFDLSQPITIVLSSANLSNVTSAGGFLTGFDASGTGNIAGTGYIIPEPGSLAIAGLGLLSLAFVGLRRRCR